MWTWHLQVVLWRLMEAMLWQIHFATGQTDASNLLSVEIIPPQGVFLDCYLTIYNTTVNQNQTTNDDDQAVYFSQPIPSSIDLQLFDDLDSNFCYTFVWLDSSSPARTRDNLWVWVNGGLILQHQMDPWWSGNNLNYYVYDAGMFYEREEAAVATWHVGSCICDVGDHSDNTNEFALLIILIVVQRTAYSLNDVKLDWFVENVTDGQVILSCGETCRTSLQSTPEWPLYQTQQCLPRNGCYRLVVKSWTTEYSAIRVSFDDHVVLRTSNIALGTSVRFGNNCPDDELVSLVEIFSSYSYGPTNLPVRYQLSPGQTHHTTTTTTTTGDNNSNWPMLSPRYDDSLLTYASFEVPKDSCVSIDPILDGGDYANCVIRWDGVVYTDQYCNRASTVLGNCSSKEICYSSEMEAVVEINTSVHHLPSGQGAPWWTVSSNWMSDISSQYDYGLFNEYKSSTEYKSLFCVPRNSCTLFYFYAGSGRLADELDYTVRVDGIDMAESKDCISIFGSRCFQTMTRLVDVGCPTPAWVVTMQRSLTILTAFCGLLIGCSIGILFKSMFGRWKKENNTSHTSEVREAAVEMAVLSQNAPTASSEDATLPSGQAVVRMDI